MLYLLIVYSNSVLKWYNQQWYNFMYTSLQKVVNLVRYFPIIYELKGAIYILEISKIWKCKKKKRTSNSIYSLCKTSLETANSDMFNSLASTRDPVALEKIIKNQNVFANLLIRSNIFT